MADSTAAKLPPLKEVVHTQSNAFFDVCALIAAAHTYLMTPRVDGKPLDDDELHRVLEVVRLRTMDVIGAFDSYI